MRKPDTMPNTKDIKDKPSPEWLLAELEKLGYKPSLQPKEARLAELRWVLETVESESELSGQPPNLKLFLENPVRTMRSIVIATKRNIKDRIQSRIKEIESNG